MAARKKIVKVESISMEELREKIERKLKTENERLAVAKDMHLIEAALSTDSLVASADREVRGLLCAVCQAGVGELASVVWVDPTIPEEEVLEWLKDGAKSEPKRKLAAEP
jgi:hypothetical protein